MNKWWKIRHNRLIIVPKSFEGSRSKDVSWRKLEKQVSFAEIYGSNIFVLLSTTTGKENRLKHKQFLFPGLLVFVLFHSKTHLSELPLTILSSGTKKCDTCFSFATLLLKSYFYLCYIYKPSGRTFLPDNTCNSFLIAKFSTRTLVYTIHIARYKQTMELALAHNRDTAGRE